MLLASPAFGCPTDKWAALACRPSLLSSPECRTIAAAFYVVSAILMLRAAPHEGLSMCADIVSSAPLLAACPQAPHKTAEPAWPAIQGCSNTCLRGRRCRGSLTSSCTGIAQHSANVNPPVTTLPLSPAQHVLGTGNTPFPALPTTGKWSTSI